MEIISVQAYTKDYRGNGHVGLQSRRLYWNLWSKVGRFDVHDAGRHWFVTMPKSSGA